MLPFLMRSRPPVRRQWTDPDFREQVIGIFVDRIAVNHVIVQSGNDHVNDKKQPQIALGVTLPVFAGIEESEHEQQYHRERKAG